MFGGDPAAIYGCQSVKPAATSFASFTFTSRAMRQYLSTRDSHLSRDMGSPSRETGMIAVGTKLQSQPVESNGRQDGSSNVLLRRSSFLSFYRFESFHVFLMFL